MGGVHLEGGLGGDGGGAAAPTGPRVWVEELAGVIRAVAESGPVEALMGPVHFLRCVALHEQIHRHDSGRLGGGTGHRAQGTGHRGAQGTGHRDTRFTPVRSYSYELVLIVNRFNLTCLHYEMEVIDMIILT